MLDNSCPITAENVPEFKMESWIVEENAILINQNLVTAFQRNNFGIDIDVSLQCSRAQVQETP